MQLISSWMIFIQLDYKSQLQVCQLTTFKLHHKRRWGLQTTWANLGCLHVKWSWGASQALGLGRRRGDIFTRFWTLYIWRRGRQEAFLSHWIRVLCYNLDQRAAMDIMDKSSLNPCEILDVLKKWYLASKALNPGLSQPKHSNNCGLHHGSP